MVTEPAVEDGLAVVEPLVLPAPGVACSFGAELEPELGLAPLVELSLGPGVALADLPGLADELGPAEELVLALGVPELLDGGGVGVIPVSGEQAVPWAMSAVVAAACRSISTFCASWTAFSSRPVSDVPVLPDGLPLDDPEDGRPLEPAEPDVPDEPDDRDEPDDPDEPDVRAPFALVDPPEPAAELADALALADAASSAAARSSFAEARSAWAWITAASSSVASNVASTWPASTESPTDALTEVTVPEVGNDAVAWFTLATVPLADSVCVTEPVETVVVV